MATVRFLLTSYDGLPYRRRIMTDHARRRLDRLLRERGLTLAAASRAIGRNHAYLQQYLRRGSPRALDLEARLGLGRLLSVPPETFAAADSGRQATALPRPARPPANAGPAAELTISAGALPRDVPVLGTTVGGNTGDFSLNGEVVDHVRRPPAMAATNKAFALYVQGDSMWPWRAPGSLVYVQPARPPRSGDHVVVEIHPETEDGPEERPCYVKRLVARTPSLLRLAQYNPARDDIEIPLHRVRALYRVMEWEELLGI